jgi:hypothetical protein
VLDGLTTLDAAARALAAMETWNGELPCMSVWSTPCSYGRRATTACIVRQWSGSRARIVGINDWR